MSLRSVAVLIFDDVELLDFAGPVQVFASFHYLFPEESERVTIIGLSNEVNISKTGMKIIPDLTVEEVNRKFDLLVIPGGMGTRAIIKSESKLQLINKLIKKSDRLASVCTGSLVLAKLGKLSGLRATTHYLAIDLLTTLDSTIIADRSKRVHDHDPIIVSEGVSAGIDMSFHLITKYFGIEKSKAVRDYIEYHPVAM